MPSRQHDVSDTLAVIPWYWRDWRASTARAALSPIGRYAYRELLDAHWAYPDCSLPDNDSRLAALTGLPIEAWQEIRDDVLSFIPLNEKGRRQHPRTLFEWKKARAYRAGCRAGGKARADALGGEERSQIAKKAAKARWSKTGGNPSDACSASIPKGDASDARRMHEHRDEHFSKHPDLNGRAELKPSDACSMLADACTPSPTPTRNAVHRPTASSPPVIPPGSAAPPADDAGSVQHSGSVPVGIRRASGSARGSRAAVPSAEAGSTLQHYVRAVVDAFNALPGAPPRASVRDEELAASWHDAGIPLSTVECAMQLVVLNRSGGSERKPEPIRSLRYFAGTVEKLVAEAPDDAYREYLRDRYLEFTGAVREEVS